MGCVVAMPQNPWAQHIEGKRINWPRLQNGPKPKTQTGVENGKPLPKEITSFLSFPSSSLGTLLAGEALLRHLIAPRPHEKPLGHQRTRRSVLHHLHGGKMDSPLHPETLF
jgi:hypothetical protein